MRRLFIGLLLCVVPMAAAQAEQQASVGAKITTASKKARAGADKIVSKTAGGLKRAGGKAAEVMSKAGHGTGKALGKVADKLRN